MIKTEKNIYSNHRIIDFLFFLIAVCFLSLGCSSFEKPKDVHVVTNAYYLKKGTNIPLRSSFAVLESENPEDKIFDKELKGKIEKLLVKNGFIIDDETKAKYIIFVLSYSVEGERGWEALSPFSVLTPPKTFLERLGRAGEFTHDMKRSPQQYLGEVRFIVYRNEDYQKAKHQKEWWRKADRVWEIHAFSQTRVENYKAILDYVLTAAIRSIVKEPDSIDDVIIHFNDKDILLLNTV